VLNGRPRERGYRMPAAERRRFEPLLDDEICPAANGVGFTLGDLDEFVSDRRVRGLANEELERVMRLRKLPGAIQTGFAVGIEGEATETLSGFFGIFFGKHRLVPVAAFECDAHKDLAVAIEDLAQIVHLVKSPGLERRSDQHRVLSGLDTFQHILAHVRGRYALAMEVKQMRHAGVTASRVAGFGASV